MIRSQAEALCVLQCLTCDYPVLGGLKGLNKAQRRNSCDPKIVVQQRVDPSRAINLDLGEPWLALLHIFNQSCPLSCLLHFSRLDSGILKLPEYLEEQGWNLK